MIDFYNLEMILVVGYRVRSHRDAQFRRWATEWLKGERALGSDYFDELFERIRDIRASEKRFYQKVPDIYALSADHDPHAESTQEFSRSFKR